MSCFDYDPVNKLKNKKRSLYEKGFTPSYELPKIMYMLFVSRHLQRSLFSLFCC